MGFLLVWRLRKAAGEGNLEKVRELLKQGADPFSTSRRRNALHRAVAGGHSEVVNHLLGPPGGNLPPETKIQLSRALKISLKEYQGKNSWKILKRLFRVGIMPGKVHLRTLLEHNPSPELVLLLVKNGLSTTTYDLITALSYSSEPALFQSLILGGANPLGIIYESFRDYRKFLGNHLTEEREGLFIKIMILKGNVELTKFFLETGWQTTQGKHRRCRASEPPFEERTLLHTYLMYTEQYSPEMMKYLARPYHQIPLETTISVSFDSYDGEEEETLIDQGLSRQREYTAIDIAREREFVHAVMILDDRIRCQEIGTEEDLKGDLKEVEIDARGSAFIVEE